MQRVYWLKKSEPVAQICGVQKSCICCALANFNKAKEIIFGNIYAQNTVAQNVWINNAELCRTNASDAEMTRVYFTLNLIQKDENK